MPASLFTITPTRPTEITLAPGEDGTFSFTITCQAAPDRSHDVILQALLVGADGKSREAEWLSVGPKSTLSMTGGETQTVVITATATVKAPLGRHTLQLALADRDRPNDTYTYSAPVVCEIKAREGGGGGGGGGTRFPMWLVAVIAGGVIVLAGGGILIWKLTSGGEDTPVVVDAPVGPSDAAVDVHTVHVTTTGDDTRDGVTGPVKTLKRAIAIANGNGAITAITLAAGKYGAANGESFPYAVPANVTLAGDPAGGTILAGTAGEGLTLDTGELHDLELRDFGVAIKATGTAALSNVRVHTSIVGVSVETAAKLKVTKLDLVGTAAACSNVGMQVQGAGQLTVTGLTARAVATVLRQADSSSVSIATATLTGDAACTTSALVVNGASFKLTDVTIDGGQDGIAFSGSTTATLTNTTIANVKRDAIVGRVKTGRITGGELRNNGRAGMEVITGTWTLTNVGIKGNPVMGIYLQGGGADTPGTLTMRGCTVTGNGNGIYLFDFAIADLGTASNPGNNTLQNNVNIGLVIDGNNGDRTIHAAGNTWRPDVQGANAQGKYGAALMNAVAKTDRNNFAIQAGWRLQL